MNTLINNQSDSTNPPHTYEECHEYDYIDVVVDKAENVQEIVRDGALSQCKAHCVHKQGDDTNTLPFKKECHICENFDLIKEKDKEVGVMGQSAANNAYSLCEASRFSHQKNGEDEERLLN